MLGWYPVVGLSFAEDSLLARVFNPRIDVADPDEHFRLRVLRTVGQLSLAGFVLALALALWFESRDLGTAFMYYTAAVTLVMGTTCLVLAGRQRADLTTWLFAAFFLFPDAYPFFGIHTTYLFIGLPILFLLLMVASRHAIIAVQVVHVGILAALLWGLETQYVLTPPQNDLSYPFSLSAYLAIYAVSILYGSSLREHVQHVHRELRAREFQLAQANKNLEDKLELRTRELLDHQEELVRARKLESMGTLAGGLAHDVNNLMASIQVSSDLIESRLETVHNVPRDLVQAVGRIQRGVQRGAALTRRMLGLVCDQPLSVESFDMGRVLDRVADQARATLPQGLEIQTAYEGELEVLGSRAELEQAIVNLTDNARDAMRGRTGTISIRAELDDKGVKVVVEDEGEGIPADLRAKVFDPFVTGKADGTGLGLAQVSRIVNEHGGRVRVDESYESGTRMVVWVPSTFSPHSSSDTYEEAKLRILLTEDELDVAGVITDVLPQSSIVHCDNGEDAIKLLEAGDDVFDLLILDMLLPRRSGRDVFDVARRRLPHVPVIVISGYASGEVLSYVLNHPRTCLLHKPFRLQELRSAVHQMTRPDGADGADPSRAALVTGSEHKDAG